MMHQDVTFEGWVLVQFAVELTRQLRQLASASPAGTPGATSAAMSTAELQCALWVRLSLLPPLLPLVYADKDSAAGGSLRNSLAPTLLTWVAACRPICRLCL